MKYISFTCFPEKKGFYSGIFSFSPISEIKEKKLLTLSRKKHKIFHELMISKSPKNFSISDGMFLAKKIEKEPINFKFLKKTQLNKEYSPLHTHSDLSLLDGASQIPELVVQAKLLGLDSLSITDHGVMNGIIDLIKECETAGIKPIAGNEMYVINGNISRNYRRSEMSKFHQIVLALTKKGYGNLVKLTTLSHLIGWQGKGAFGRPCINKKMLFKYRNGIILTSACLGGEVSQNLLNGFFSTAKNVAEWYDEYFQESFFLELQDHGHREDRAVNMKVLKISKDLNIKLLATNDSHFTNKRDVETHDTLLCVQTGKAKEEVNRMRYSGTEFLKSANEMFEMFEDHVQPNLSVSALDNSQIIANQVEDYSIWSEVKIPKFEMPKNFEDFTYDDFMKALSFEGLFCRLNDRFYNAFELEKRETFIYHSNIILPDYQRYYDRLKYELEAICFMGFSTYFLVVWDYINFARKNFIPVGPGRGSAAGSLVAYSLGITNIDPIEHGLLFERFLNPSRKSMPDIDTDFSIDGREMVIEYVSMKYGHERVAQIATFNKLTSKAILKDMGRSGQVSSPLLEKMSGMIPITRGKPVSLNLMILENSPSIDFRQLYLKNSPIKDIIDKSIRFEGMVKTTAVHAAGIVISSIKLDEIVPLTRGTKGEIVTQYPMENVELLGLLKMDFLGLKNLSMIETVVNLVNFKFRNSVLSLEADCLRPHFDSNTYNLLARGELEGIFQLDASPGMKEVVSDIRPNSIQDISSILALYRPGPLDAGLIPQFLTRKREIVFFRYHLMELKPILSETYGILLYQEQIMKVAQEMGGYSLDQADLLRRAMGKKKLTEMQMQKKTFLDGCLNNSFEKNSSVELFYQVVGFAEYCFNKSHSTAYAFTTYQTAWLKSHWPVEFFSSLLSANLGDTEKIEKFVFQAATFGVFVNQPCLNTSDVFFFPEILSEKQSFLSFGLGSINNIGEAVAVVIVTERKVNGIFESLTDIIERLTFEHFLGKKTIESLILCGSVDKVGKKKNRNKLISNLDQIIKWLGKKQKSQSRSQTSLLDLNWINEPINFTRKGLSGNKKGKYQAEKESEESELQILEKELTSLSVINFSLLEEAGSILITGSFFPQEFTPIYFQNLEADQYYENFSLKKKTKIHLGVRENQLINQLYNEAKHIWFIGIILEIQTYNISGTRIMLKLFIEDIAGLKIGLRFIDFREMTTKKQVEIQSKFFPSSGVNSKMIGKKVYGYGVFQEDVNQETTRLVISDLICLSEGKVVILTLNPVQVNNNSIHSLIKTVIANNPSNRKDESFLVPILLNVEGEKRSELIRTGFCITTKLAKINVEKFKKLGFRCGLFKLN